MNLLYTNSQRVKHTIMTLAMAITVGIAGLSAPALSYAQERVYDSPVDFPEFAELQQDSTRHVAAYADTVDEFAALQPSIEQLNTIADIEDRLIAAVAIKTRFADMIDNVNGQIAALTNTVNDMLTSFEYTPNTSASEMTLLEEQRARIDALAATALSEQDVYNIDDDIYAHVTSTANNMAIIGAIDTHADYHGTTLRASEVNRYLDLRLRDLDEMTFTRDILTRLSSNLSGLVQRRGQQEASSVTAATLPKSVSQVNQQLSDLAKAILMDEQELSKVKANRTGNPFVLSKEEAGAQDW